MINLPGSCHRGQCFENKSGSVEKEVNDTKTVKDGTAIVYINDGV